MLSGLIGMETWLRRSAREFGGSEFRGIGNSGVSRAASEYRPKVNGPTAGRELACFYTDGVAKLLGRSRLGAWHAILGDGPPPRFGIPPPRRTRGYQVSKFR